MAQYLLHQSLDGTVRGVFSSTQHLYLPEDVQFQDYGVNIVQDRPPAISFTDWAYRLTQQYPGMARWSLYDHAPAALLEILLAAKFDTSYEGDR